MKKAKYKYTKHPKLEQTWSILEDTLKKYSYKIYHKYIKPVSLYNNFNKDDILGDAYLVLNKCLWLYNKDKVNGNEENGFKTYLYASLKRSLPRLVYYENKHRLLERNKVLIFDTMPAKNKTEKYNFNEILGVIQDLPYGYGDILIQYYLDGKPIKGIAKEHGCKYRQSISNKKHNALTKLRKQLQVMCNNE